MHSQTGVSDPSLSRAEGVHDILQSARPHSLESIFAPRRVALIGATESPGTVGRSLLENLLAGAGEREVFPVNPRRESVLGVKAWPSLRAIGQPVDLAVIVTQAASVPDIVRDCVDTGAGGVVIISAGFKETGPAGAELERRVFAEARRGGLRIIGPNCLGVMVPHRNFNATFGTRLARPGPVGFLSQSGALCTAVLDWSVRENVGFSAFVSLGSMVDAGWGDLIQYLGDDPHTRSILIYMETVGDARAFLSAAREVSLTKPIIVIKAGRTEAAARAAASHTGSLTGSDAVLDAAFRRCGVLRVDTIEELFDMAEVLAKQPRPRGPHLTMVTNAGGPAVLATDMLVGAGGRLTELAPATMERLNQTLPPHWSHNNPVDIIGDASPALYAKATEIAASDPGTDGLLVILTPQAMTDPTETARQLAPFAKRTGKPLLASWMGGDEVEPGRTILNDAGIPTYNYPDRAARAFHHMWRYSENLHALYETPSLSPDSGENLAVRDRVARILQNVRQTGRTLLTELEAKHVLRAYDIPTTRTEVAITATNAARLAAEIGFPVVLKLHSRTITHKTDVGGVRLNLTNGSEVRTAFREIHRSVADKAGEEHFHGVTVQPMVRFDGYELILGSSVDPQFGPVLLFGLGGQLVEVFRDSALALPPLNATLARRMMERTRVFQALKGVRGRRPADLAALEQLLVRFSRLVVEQPWIREMDINPLLVSSDQLIAVDARLVLHGPDLTEAQLPRPAIRPYPMRYISRARLNNGDPVLIRPIRPEDEPAMAAFHQTLSEGTVYLRYFSALKLSERVAHERLARICFVDFDRQMVLVATRRDKTAGREEIAGVARLARLRGTDDAEFALLVSDPCQRLGLGAELMRRLIDVGRAEGVKRIIGDVLADNPGMLRLCEKLGFTREYQGGEHTYRVWLAL
jgi:acetyltransferase